MNEKSQKRSEKINLEVRLKFVKEQFLSNVKVYDDLSYELDSKKRDLETYSIFINELSMQIEKLENKIKELE